MVTNITKSKKEYVSSPTLNTVIMVEETLKDSNSSAISIADLKKLLPKQVNHNTLKIILGYLEKSKKIVFGINGITWVENNNVNLQKEINSGLEL